MLMRSHHGLYWPDGKEAGQNRRDQGRALEPTRAKQIAKNSKPYVYIYIFGIYIYNYNYNGISFSLKIQDPNISVPSAGQVDDVQDHSGRWVFHLHICMPVKFPTATLIPSGWWYWLGTSAPSTRRFWTIWRSSKMTHAPWTHRQPLSLHMATLYNFQVAFDIHLLKLHGQVLASGLAETTASWDVHRRCQSWHQDEQHNEPCQALSHVPTTV